MNKKGTMDNPKDFLYLDLKELLEKTREHRYYFTTKEIANLLIDSFGKEINIIIKDIKNEEKNRINSRAEKDN